MFLGADGGGEIVYSSIAVEQVKTIKNIYSARKPENFKMLKERIVIDGESKWLLALKIYAVLCVNKLVRLEEFRFLKTPAVR